MAHCLSYKARYINREYKSRIRETPNLSTDADSSTNIFFPTGVKKEADRCIKKKTVSV